MLEFALGVLVGAVLSAFTFAVIIFLSGNFPVKSPVEVTKTYKISPPDNRKVLNRTRPEFIREMESISKSGGSSRDDYS